MDRCNLPRVVRLVPVSNVQLLQMHSTVCSGSTKKTERTVRYLTKLGGTDTYRALGKTKAEGSRPASNCKASASFLCIPLFLLGRTDRKAGHGVTAWRPRGSHLHRQLPSETSPIRIHVHLSSFGTQTVDPTGTPSTSMPRVSHRP